MDKRIPYETKMYVNVQSKVSPQHTTQKEIPITLDLREIFTARPGLKDDGRTDGCIISIGKGNFWIIDDYPEIRNYMKEIWGEDTKETK